MPSAYKIMSTAALQKAAGYPLAITFRPFYEENDQEATVPVTDYSHFCNPS
jgi:hypothetical protein